MLTAIGVKDSLKKVSGRLTSIINNVDHSALVQKGDALSIIKLIQLVCGLRYESKEEEKLHELIVSAALKAEKMSPGSFVGCITETVSKLNGTKNEAKLSSTCQGRLPSRDDIEKFIAETIDCVVSRHALSEALSLSGLTGKIVVEKSATDTVSVEQVLGYSFALSPMFGKLSSMHRPKVLCIDGFVESVSEIHHLLQDASETRVPGLLFMRGASDEVIHTLRANYDRGSLKIIPVIVRYDLEGINTLNDIAVVCGTDVVSSLKGQLISSVRWADAPFVDSANVFYDKVSIMNQSSQRSVAAHVSALYEKRSEQHDESVASLIDKRIRTLTSNQVIIRIPDDSMFIVRSQSLDYALRIIRNAVDFGISIDGKLATSHSAILLYSSSCERTLSDLGTIIRL